MGFGFGGRAGLGWGKGAGRKRKNHVLERVVFFHGLPIRNSIVPMLGARAEVENEKTTF